MADTIDLYNFGHNGDLFFSRMLISMLKNTFNINYYYNLKSTLFHDLSNINEIIGIPSTYSEQITDIQNRKINTWIGQSNLKYTKNINIGCTFENYFFLYKEICSVLGVSVDLPPESYLPFVNFEKIKNKIFIDNVLNSYKKIYKNIVLICNGDVHSGQASNFNFYTIIKQLCERHPDILFLLTKSESKLSENVINTIEITKTSPDLVEISYISLFCDIIVGRASGPYCFSQNINNLNNPNKTFIGFSSNKLESKFYSNMKSRFVWSDNYDIKNIYNTINHQIETL